MLHCLESRTPISDTIASFDIVMAAVLSAQQQLLYNTLFSRRCEHLHAPALDIILALLYALCCAGGRLLLEAYIYADITISPMQKSKANSSCRTTVYLHLYPVLQQDTMRCAVHVLCIQASLQRSVARSIFQRAHTARGGSSRSHGSGKQHITLLSCVSHT
jgi:hypothetical protein